MKKLLSWALAAVLLLAALPAALAESTPVSRHGALRVENGALVDAQGEPYQLYGMSTHGLAWFPQYVNAESFRTLRDDWKVNCVRLALYTAESGGYCTDGDQEALRQRVYDGVDAATALGLYVVVDWHILRDGNPLDHQAEALAFFTELSARYAQQENVLYELCNEPNGLCKWEQITAYAGALIPAIRANDPDALVLVGTPSWSQEITRALKAPLAFDNVLYTLHFYAATHGASLRDALTRAVQGGLPVFISEFGLCEASGDGAIDDRSAESWKALIEQYNLSYLCWNLSNNAEASSVLLPACKATGGWTDDDLSEQGRRVVDWFRSEPNP